MFLKSMTAFLALTGAAIADWRVSPVDPLDHPDWLFSEKQIDAATITDAGLPDGRVATGKADIGAAWYEGPTRRYAHAILGDAIEAGSLVVRLADGTRLSLDLPSDQVFEDRYPRLADLDGDGRDEVITIRSSRSGGGGVAIYGVRDRRIVERAHVPTIGLSNRWLNIAGIADFHPRKGLEIAFVKTPHIGGTLRLFGWGEGALPLIEEDWGYSNHAIGSPEMRLSAIADLDQDGFAELALPSEDRRSLKIVKLSGGIDVIANVPLPARVTEAILFEDDSFVVGFASGKVVRVEKEP